MEANAFLDLFLAQVDQVAATDGDNAALRVERTFDLNEVSIDFVQAYDFSWMLKSGTGTLSSGGYELALASDFDNIGANGGVFRTADGERMSYRAPSVIMAQRLDPSYRPTLPDEYSIFSVSSGLEMIQTATLGAACGITYLYKKHLPAITDAANGAFLNIPEAHQRGVIWIGMMAKAKAAVGDRRYSDFRDHPSYVAAKRAAIKSDQKGKEEAGQLASFFAERG